MKITGHESATLNIPEDDPLASYRGQFQRGMERYKEGALSEAIGYWEPVYRELGERNGYRLAYNLGIAYQELGDATHAAERFQSFLGEVDARRERGDSRARGRRHCLARRWQAVRQLDDATPQSGAELRSLARAS